MFRSSFDAVRMPVIETTSTSKGYNCDLCKEGGWNTEADVDIHRKKKHRLQLKNMLRKFNSMCAICLRQQKNRKALIKHIKTHHFLTPPNSIRIEREIYFCDICKNLFFNKDLLIAHIQHKHMLTKEQKRRARICCPKCFKNIRVKSLWFHFSGHNMLVVSTCPICLKYFEHSELMLEHIKTHPGYYQCCICDYDTSKEQYFTSHVHSHKKLVTNSDLEDKTDVFQYFLPGNKLRPWNLKIRNHFKGLPLTKDVQICVMCRQMCLNHDQMIEHIYGDHRQDLEVQRKKHICVCGEVFFNSVLLKHHVFKLKEGHRALEKNEFVPDNSENILCEVVEILDTNVEQNSNEINLVFAIRRPEETES